MATLYHKACEHCSSEFTVIARNKKQRFCCSECVRLSRKRIREDKCIQCGTPLTSRYQTNFCSRSCSATYYNKIRPRTEEVKEKIRQSVLKYLIKNPPKKKEKTSSYSLPPMKTKECQVCGKTHITRFNRKTCSDACMRISMSRQKTEYLKNPENRKKYKGSQTQSYMEASFEQWLLNNGICKGLNGYIPELHFYNPETKKHGWADFAFPKLKLIIELDGTHHLKRKELDEIRDAYLASRGYAVLRITINEYKKRKWVDDVKELLGVVGYVGIEPTVD